MRWLQDKGDNGIMTKRQITAAQKMLRRIATDLLNSNIDENDDAVIRAIWTVLDRLSKKEVVS